MKRLDFKYCIPATSVVGLAYGFLASALFIPGNLVSADKITFTIAAPALFGAALVSMLWTSNIGLLLVGGVVLLIYSSNHSDWYFFGFYIALFASLEVARIIWGTVPSPPPQVSTPQNSQDESKSE